jgi:hypothetical protein
METIRFLLGTKISEGPLTFSNNVDQFRDFKNTMSVR